MALRDLARRVGLTAPMPFDLGKPYGLTRSPMPPRTKPIARVSAKQASENRLRSRLVHGHFGDGRDEVVPCQMGGIWAKAADLDDLAPVERRALAAHDCWRVSWDAHERLTRGRGGSIVDVENITPGCRPCHDLCDFLPALALRVGLLHSSKPGT